MPNINIPTSKGLIYQNVRSSGFVINPTILLNIQCNVKDSWGTTIGECAAPDILPTISKCIWQLGPSGKPCVSNILCSHTIRRQTTVGLLFFQWHSLSEIVIFATTWQNIILFSIYVSISPLQIIHIMI